MPKTRAISFCPAITDDVLTHPNIEDGEPFVIDLQTIILPSTGEIRSIDYEHESGVGSQIGDCFDFEVGAEGVVAKGVLISSQEKDTAGILIQKLSDGMTFGASPRIELDKNQSEWIDEGQTVSVRGVDRQGPFRLYRNSVIRSLSVSRQPTDLKTRIVLLSETQSLSLSNARGVYLLANPNPEKEENAMAEETKTDETQAESNTLLKQLADKIGPEKAIAAFEQSGGEEGLKQILDSFAILENFGIEFNAAEVAPVVAPQEEELSKEEDEDDDEEKKKSSDLSKIIQPLVKQVAALAKQNNVLAAKIANLSISDPVSGSMERETSEPKEKEGYDKDAERAKIKNLLG